MDILSRRILGWVVDGRMAGTLASRALLMAIDAPKAMPRLLLYHSDRGSLLLSQSLYGTILERTTNCLSNRINHRSVYAMAMKRRIQFIRSRFIMPCLLLLLGVLLSTILHVVDEGIRNNSLHLSLLRLYLDTEIETGDRYRLLELLWQQSCGLHDWPECIEHEDLDAEQVLRVMDSRLVSSAVPLILLKEELVEELNLASFSIGGVSGANRASSTQKSTVADYITLWGSGYIEARLFTFVPRNGSLAVLALNDSPPPVELDVELNDLPRFSLVFDKGDGTWEIKTTDTVALSSGFNRLRIWYLNDLFDASLNLDRNAYIKSVSIRRF